MYHLVEVVEGHSRVVLLGAAGTGKTWLVREHVGRLATDATRRIEAGAEPADVDLPVLVRCDELLETGRPTVGGAVATIVGRRDSDLPGPLIRWSATHIDAGRAVMLLDGLDLLLTVPERSALTALLRRWPGDRFVLTSRTAGYVALAPELGLVEADVLPVDRQGIRTYLGLSGLRPAAADRVATALPDDPSALALTTVATVAAVAGQDPDHDCLATLQERAVWRLLELDRWSSVAGSSDHGVLVGTSRSEAWLDQLSVIALDTAERSIGRFGPIDLDSIAGLRPHELSRIEQLTRHSHVMGITAGPDGRQFHFTDQPATAYLAARRLARMSYEDWSARIRERIWLEPDWTEIIVILGGLLDDPTRLLDLLLDQTDDPFHAATRTAARTVAGLSTVARARLARTHAVTIVTRALNLVDTDADMDARGILRDLGAGIAAAGEEQITEWLGSLEDDKKKLFLLSDAVSQPDVQTAFSRLIALGDIRMAEEAAEALSKVDPTPRVRDALFARLEDPDSVLAELSGADEHGLEYVRAFQRAYVEPQLAHALSGVTSASALVRLVLIELAAADVRVRMEGLRKAVTVATEPEVRTALIDRLADVDPLVRLEAYRTLATVASHPEVRTALRARVDELNSSGEAGDVQVQRELLLGMLDEGADHAAIEGPLSRLDDLDDPDVRVRIEAVHSLSRRVVEPAIRDRFVDLLSDSTRVVREQVAECLASAVQYDVGVRQACVNRVAEPGLDPRAAALLVSRLAVCRGRLESVVRNAVLELLVEDDPEIRSKATGAARKSATDPIVRSALLVRLHDRSATVRRAAADALAGAASDPQVRRELSQLQEHSDPGVRERIESAVVKAVDAEPDDWKPLLMRVLDPGYPHPRVVAWLTEMISERRYRLQLMQRMRHGDRTIRAAAVAMLWRTTPDPEEFFDLVESAPLHRFDHHLARESLADPDVGPAMRRVMSTWLEHSDRQVRSRALGALRGSVSDRRVRRALLAALHRPGIEPADVVDVLVPDALGYPEVRSALSTALRRGIRIQCRVRSLCEYGETLQAVVDRVMRDRWGLGVNDYEDLQRHAAEGYRKLDAPARAELLTKLTDITRRASEPRRR